MRPNRMALLAVCTALVCSFAVAQPGAATDRAWPDLPAAKALLEVFGTIHDSYYLTPAELDENALWQAAIDGMLDALPDRYTFYDGPEAVADEESLADFPYGGIGVELTELDPATELGTQVITVFPDGPAARAGLLPGDVILEVDGHDTLDQPAWTTRFMIAGRAGTAVRLLVGRPGHTGPITFEIIRGQIEAEPPEPVTSRLLGDGVGYLSFADFEEPDLGRLVRERLTDLKEAGATALVLDLRDNVGGSTAVAREVLSEFLYAKPLWTFSARGRRTGEDRSGFTPSWAPPMPLVVLVNARTYSMGEAAAAVLRLHERALVVGERTWGNGVETRTVDLSGGGALTYAAYELLLPGGQSLEGVGVVPDVFAPDARWPSMIVARGNGAQAGQLVELTVDGVVVARAIAGESGFDLVGTTTGGPYTSPASSIPDPATDPALRAAIATVVGLREATGTAAGD